MKHKNKITLLAGAILLTTAFFSVADAQRNRNDNGGERHSEKRDNPRTDRTPSANTDRSFQRGQDRSQSNSNNSYQRGQDRNLQSNATNNGLQRNQPRQFQRNNQQIGIQRNTVTPRQDLNNNSRNLSNANNNRFSNGSRGNDYSRYQSGRNNNTNTASRITPGRSYSSNYNRNYSSSFSRGNNFYNRSRFISWRPTYRTIPRTYISLNFGGHPYYYGDGYFYDYYDGYYRPFFPQSGFHISFLPYGYYPLYMGPDLFYYSNGSYYRRYNDTDYEVVDAPLGAEIPTLPANTKSVMINGEKFYELNGTYYKEGTDSNGKVMYTVVGKNGEINNTEDEQAPAASSAPLRVGDIVDQLPPDCKKVEINGQELLVTPDEVYLKEERDNNNTVVYRVVGVSDNSL